MTKRKKSTRGRLLKGIAKLPATLLDNSFFKPAVGALLKGSPGIYALYKREELYYVGLSKNLSGRIKQHLDDRHKGKWDTFKVFTVSKVHYLKDLETLILQVARPPGNRQTGRLPKNQRRALELPFKAALKKMERETKSIRRSIKFRRKK